MPEEIQIGALMKTTKMKIMDSYGVDGLRVSLVQGERTVTLIKEYRGNVVFIEKDSVIFLINEYEFLVKVISMAGNIPWNILKKIMISDCREYEEEVDTLEDLPACNPVLEDEVCTEAETVNLRIAR